MSCSSSSLTPPPAPLSYVAKSSNLQDYRALLQVLTYASQREQTAEQVVRDALTGGVVVPFTFPCLGVAGSSSQASHIPTGGARSFPSTPCAKTDADDALPCDGAEKRSTILLPASKFVGTTASLLAAGFFCFSPLSFSAENSRQASLQYRSESEVRDLFTLIILLFPECFVSDKLLRALTAAHLETVTPCPLQSVTKSTPASLRASSAVSCGLHTPPPNPILSTIDEGTRVLARTSPLGVDTFDHASAALATPVLSRSRRIVSPASGASHGSDAEECISGGSGGTSPAENVAALPAVDPVSLSSDVLDALLASRRSLAMVLLSLLNDALHEVQYRQLEQSRGVTKELPKPSTKKPPKTAEAILHFSEEVLLTAKLLLLNVVCASERWRACLIGPTETAQTDVFLASSVATRSSPYLLLCELVHDEPADVQPFVSRPVEQWSWGRSKEALTLWYETAVARLIAVSEEAGIHFQTCLYQAKSRAVGIGRNVTAFPALLLHRPSDGLPAVEMSLAGAPHQSDILKLPTMPIQQGELHWLQDPCVRTSERGNLHSRGHELLIDTAPSPTAIFLQACMTKSFLEAQLQPVSGKLPTLFRRPPSELSCTEQSILQSSLSDPLVLAAVLEKNAPLLARLTLWCRGAWPPPSPPSVSSDKKQNGTDEVASRETIEIPTSVQLREVATQVEQCVLFQRPFNVAVGRYVRDLVTLNGLHQEVLEAWVRHICASEEGAVSSPHRKALAALVKFAVLHNRWTLSPEVEDLERLLLH